MPSIANCIFLWSTDSKWTAFGYSPNIRRTNKCCSQCLGYTFTSTFLSFRHASFGICVQMWTRLYTAPVHTKVWVFSPNTTWRIFEDVHFECETFLLTYGVPSDQFINGMNGLPCVLERWQIAICSSLQDCARREAPKNVWGDQRIIYLFI